jgi:hypothetical protein
MKRLFVIILVRTPHPLDRMQVPLPSLSREVAFSVRPHTMSPEDRKRKDKHRIVNCLKASNRFSAGVASVTHPERFSAGGNKSRESSTIFNDSWMGQTEEANNNESISKWPLIDATGQPRTLMEEA